MFSNQGLGIEEEVFEDKQVDPGIFAISHSLLGSSLLVFSWFGVALCCQNQLVSSQGMSRLMVRDRQVSRLKD